jgi:anti-anti-sigma regulatory factor
MGYIIVSRNPRTQRLIVITGEDEDQVAEFGTESEASAVAMAVPVCEAWGYEVVEVS